MLKNKCYSTVNNTIINLIICIINCTVKPVFGGHLNILEEVCLHDRCPFTTGSLTWEDRKPLCEDVSWSEGTLSLQCPLKMGFDVCIVTSLSLELQKNLSSRVTRWEDTLKSGQIFSEWCPICPMLMKL